MYEGNFKVAAKSYVNIMHYVFKMIQSEIYVYHGCLAFSA